MMPLNRYQTLNITPYSQECRYTEGQTELGMCTMSQFNLSPNALPPDDLPPLVWLDRDRQLRQELQAALCKYFYQACDGVTQGLLMLCEWHLLITGEALILVLQCPTQPISWRALNNVEPLGLALRHFSPTAKIRVCPPPDSGDPVEIRIDEISV
jgi:hypothetical protein